MSDEELLPDGVPSFDDPTYDALRADLAAARLDEPMPLDVAALLDAALADEAAGGAGPGRRRWAPRLLVAAVAGVLLLGGGIGLAQALHGSATGGGATSTVAGGAPTVEQQDTLRAPAAAAPDPQISRAHFAHDVTVLLHSDLLGKSTSLDALGSSALAGTAAGSGGAGSAAGAAVTPPVPAPAPAATPTGASGSGAVAGGSGSAGSTGGGTTTEASTGPLPHQPAGAAPAPGAQTFSSAQTCDPVIPGAQTEPILLDGTPAVLVIHPASGGHQLVEARDCSGRTVLASAELPA
jgi:hypothetical protein